MTKEELEKEAGDYADKHAFRVPYDGSNKFYDDVDFKASKEGYLAGAEPREKRIAELKQENKELVDENETLKEQVNILKNCDKLGDTITEAYKEQLAQAKELLQNLIRVTWGEGWNYSLDWKAKAEQFLKEIEK